ncbi:MAG: hypothetical protein M3Y17_08210 [Actinomycetota bacterium]|nr:hypothetical protein [Actinomycetota bacterium]
MLGWRELSSSRRGEQPIYEPQRAIVCIGLVLLGASFFWIAQDSATVPYGIIVIQMVMMSLTYGAGYVLVEQVLDRLNWD